MTREAMFPDKMTKFSAWIRVNCDPSKDGLTLTNLDYIVRRFEDPANMRVMLIEEKTRGENGGKMTWSQSQTFKMLDAVLTVYCLEHSLNYLGFYLIQFENESPDDSEWIKINNKIATADELRQHINMAVMHVSRAGQDVKWDELIN